MTKVIEIVVIGATGSGKSHVLEVISKALRAEYGHHAQIASHDLSCERGLGSPGSKPSVSSTIFNLREQGAPTADQPPGRLMIITTPQQLSDAGRAAQIARYQGAADHAGAHLLLIDGGASASFA